MASKFFDKNFFDPHLFDCGETISQGGWWHQARYERSRREAERVHREEIEAERKRVEEIQKTALIEEQKRIADQENREHIAQEIAYNIRIREILEGAHAATIETIDRENIALEIERLQASINAQYRIEQQDRKVRQEKAQKEMMDVIMILLSEL